MSDKSRTAPKMFRKLFPFIKPYGWWIGIVIVSSMANAAINILIPYMFKNMADIAITGQRQEWFSEYLILMLALIGVYLVSSYANTYSVSRYKTGIVRDMQNKIAGHMMRLPVSYMDGSKSGDLVSRLNSDVDAMQGFLNEIPNFIYQPLVFIGAFTYALLISWKLLLAAVILIPGAMYLSNRLNKPMREYYTRLQEHFGLANSAIQDTIGGIHVMKAFNLKDVLYNKYKSIIMTILDWSMKIEKRNAAYAPVGTLLVVVPMLTVNLFGGYLALQKELSVGNFIFYLYLVGYLIGPARSAAGLIGTVRQAQGASSRLFEILDQPVEGDGGKSFDSARDGFAVEFKDVSFSYNEEKKVLEHMSFCLPRGRTTALVGASGSGKTTVFKLLCGFYKAQEGQIKLFGNRLDDWDITAARRKISLVSQDTYVFPLSVAENIAYGRPGASMDEVAAAAKAAYAHDFIMELPEGYNTLVGERGARLSGGQRQRIAIARAILKDAPVLLLDEPSSALDAQSEALVQEALEALSKDRTVLIIAHRLSTVKQAHEVLVMDNGCIAERGTHEQLIAKGGLYRQLYTGQLAAVNTAAHGGSASDV